MTESARRLVRQMNALCRVQRRQGFELFPLELPPDVEQQLRADARFYGFGMTAIRIDGDQIRFSALSPLDAWLEPPERSPGTAIRD